MDHVIATEGLTRRFGRLAAVHELTLHVPAGSIFGLIGPNGAGKTTTLKTLMNLVEPSSGTATVLGVDSRRLGPAQFARIGYVSESQQQPSWMTVRELLAWCKPLYPTWDDALCARLVALLDLPLDRKVRHLSRGMRMKAALVSSLAYRPALLVLDEPFTGLDPLMRDELVQGVLELAGDGGWSAVISSHDLDEIERLIDWIGYLRGGELAFAESTAELQARVRRIDITLPNAGDAGRHAGMGAAPSAKGPAGASAGTADIAAGAGVHPGTGQGGASHAAVPAPLPAGWLSAAAADRALQLVHVAYAGGDTERDLLARFPGAQLQVTPLSLRETFVAFARQDREQRSVPSSTESVSLQGGRS